MEQKRQAKEDDKITERFSKFGSIEKNFALPVCNVKYIFTFKSNDDC